jgi:predicted membrane protein
VTYVINMYFVILFQVHYNIYVVVIEIIFFVTFIYLVAKNNNHSKKKTRLIMSGNVICVLRVHTNKELFCVFMLKTSKNLAP